MFNPSKFWVEDRVFSQSFMSGTGTQQTLNKLTTIMNFAELIETKFKVTYTPICVLTRTSGVVGYFQDFSDAQELKAEGKYRFIQLRSSNAFREELRENGVYNSEHSIVLSADEIVSITHCMTIYGAEALKNAAIGYLGRQLPTSDRRRFEFAHIDLIVTTGGEAGVQKFTYQDIQNIGNSIKETLAGHHNVLNIELKARLVELNPDNPEVKHLNLEFLLSIL